MRHKFRLDRSDGDYVEVGTGAVSWPELLEEFERYLKACGFELPGTLACDVEDDEGEKEG